MLGRHTPHFASFLACVALLVAGNNITIFHGNPENMKALNALVDELKGSCSTKYFDEKAIRNHAIDTLAERRRRVRSGHDYTKECRGPGLFLHVHDDKGRKGELGLRRAKVQGTCSGLGMRLPMFARHMMQMFSIQSKQHGKFLRPYFLVQRLLNNRADEDTLLY